MSALQRSTKSFRRQGSSGLVWDDKVLSEDINELMRKEGNNEGHREVRHCYSIGGNGTMVGTEADSLPVFTRSLSAPSTKAVPSEMLGNKGVGTSGKPPNILKSESKKHA